MERKLKIITADQRLSETQGVKALILGRAGIGKTSLLNTVAQEKTLFVDLEAGDLAVKKLQIDTLRPKTWEECRDLAVYLGGANPALPATSCYSQAHYDAIAESMGGPQVLDKYDTYFIDSITVAGRLCFTWAAQQPESFSERGKKDVRGTYGLLGREMISWLTHLQHARGKNVIFVGIMETITDDFNVKTFQLQIDGGKTGRELPGIVDQIVTMEEVEFGEGKAYRAFVCTQPNPWKYPAKDRSGLLEQIEEPHLGKWLAKLTSGGERKELTHTIPQQSEAA